MSPQGQGFGKEREREREFYNLINTRTFPKMPKNVPATLLETTTGTVEGFFFCFFVFKNKLYTITISA